MTPRLYVSHEKANNPLPRALADIYRDIGITGVRYMPQWPQLEPERGKFDWSWSDETIDNAVAAGLTMCVNPYFFPAWVTGGFDCMSSYDCACAKGAVSLPDSGESAKCYSEYVVDDTACFDLGVALAKRYGGRVESWGVFNEPGVRLYWLTTRTQLAAEDGAKDAIDAWYRAVLPFMMGVTRTVRQSPTFVTQFDAFCDYAHCLNNDGGWFNVPGIHPYADVPATVNSEHVLHGIDIDLTTDEVLDKINFEFLPRIEPYRNGRPVAITEIQHCDNVKLMRRTGMDVTEHDPARYVTMHDEWSPNGPVLVPGLPGGKREFVLTKEGEELKRELAQMTTAAVPSRRRSVTS